MATNSKFPAPQNVEAIRIHRWPDADAGLTYLVDYEFGKDLFLNFREALVIEGNDENDKREGVVRIDLENTQHSAIGIDDDDRENETDDLMRKAGFFDQSHGHRAGEISDNPWMQSSAGIAYYRLFVERGRTPPAGLEWLVKAVIKNDVDGSGVEFTRPFDPIHGHMTLFMQMKKGVHMKICRDPASPELGQWVNRDVAEALELERTIFKSILYARAEEEAGRPMEPLAINGLLAEWISEYYELFETSVVHPNDAWAEELRKRAKFGECWTNPHLAMATYSDGYLKERVLPRFCAFMDKPALPVKFREQAVLMLPFWLGSVYRYYRDVVATVDCMELAKRVCKDLLEGVIRLVEDYELSYDDVQATKAFARDQAKRGVGPFFWQTINGLVLMRIPTANNQAASVAHKPESMGGGGVNIALIEMRNKKGKETGNWMVSFGQPNRVEVERKMRKDYPRIPDAVLQRMVDSRMVVLAATLTRIRQQVARAVRVSDLIKAGYESRHINALVEDKKFDGLNTPADLKKALPGYDDRLYIFVPNRWMPENMADGEPVPMWVFNSSLTHDQKSSYTSVDQVWELLIDIVAAVPPRECTYYISVDNHCSAECPFFHARLFACMKTRIRMHGGTDEAPGPDTTAFDDDFLARKENRRDLRRAEGLKAKFAKNPKIYQSLAPEDQELLQLAFLADTRLWELREQMRADSEAYKNWSEQDQIIWAIFAPEARVKGIAAATEYPATPEDDASEGEAEEPEASNDEDEDDEERSNEEPPPPYPPEDAV